MDMLLQWFENRIFFDLPNYFWVLCGFIVLVVLLLVLLILTNIKKHKKIKTIKAVLDAEISSHDVIKDISNDVPEEDANVKVEQSTNEMLSSENEQLSQELIAVRAEKESALSEIETLKAENTNLTSKNAELTDLLVSKSEELQKALSEQETMASALENYKANNVRYVAEITSYKATNDILSKSIDETRAQNEELKELVSKLNGIQKKADEAEADNKVLMRAVNLIMSTKDAQQPSETIILEKSSKPTRRQQKKSETSQVELESLKRPDLMHLAKKEGVQHFARKSNKEIIRLIRENRKNK